MNLIHTILHILQCGLFGIFLVYVYNERYISAILIISMLIISLMLSFYNPNKKPSRKNKPMKNDNTIIFQKNLDFEERFDQFDEKRKIIKKLDIKYPNLKKYDVLCNWFKLFEDYNLRYMEENDILEIFESVIKQFNDYFSRIPITINTQKDTKIYNDRYGTGIFKYWSPNASDIAIVKFDNENFSMTIHGNKLFEYTEGK